MDAFECPYCGYQEGDIYDTDGLGDIELNAFATCFNEDCNKDFVLVYEFQGIEKR